MIKRSSAPLLASLWLQRLKSPPRTCSSFEGTELLEASLLTIVVAHHLLKRPDFFFIQVGAFDGVQVDPITKFYPSVQLERRYPAGASAAKRSSY